MIDGSHPINDGADLRAKRGAYEAALDRYRKARRRGTRFEEWRAAAEADRARLEYYKARDALELSPMTEPLVLPEVPEQFTAAIRGTPTARRDVLSLVFNLAMPFLLFLGVALPLLVYAFAAR